MQANRMTPAIPIMKRDEIKSAEEGFLYKRRTAVCQMLPVTQNDGRCTHPVQKVQNLFALSLSG